MGVLSAKCREPLCNPAFSQVMRDRKGRSNALLQPARINVRASGVATGKVCQQPVAGKAMGLPVGAAAPSSVTVTAVSGCRPDPSPAVGAPGG
jgi:hypothetical protein